MLEICCRCEPGLHPRLRWQRSTISKKAYLLKKEKLLKDFLEKYNKYLKDHSNKNRTHRRKRLSNHKGADNHIPMWRRKRSAEVATNVSLAHLNQTEETGAANLTQGVFINQKQKRALLMGHQTQQRQQLINRRKDGGRGDSKKKNRGGGGNGGDDENGEERGGTNLNKLKSGRGKGVCILPFSFYFSISFINSNCYVEHHLTTIFYSLKFFSSSYSF